MKHFHIRSFHASHQLNLQPMDNEREYLPWMSDSYHTLLCCNFELLEHLLTSVRSDLIVEYRLAAVDLEVSKWVAIQSFWLRMTGASTPAQRLLSCGTFVLMSILVILN